MIKIPNLSGFSKIAGIGKAFVMANRPELLFGASVVSTVGAVGLAAKGGYEARGIVERERADRVLNSTDTWFPNYLAFSEAMDNAPDLDIKEKISLTWKLYIPAAIGTLTSLSSTTGLHIVHVKEKKALATAALAAIDEVKSSAREYQAKALNLIDDDSKTPEEKRDELEGVDWRSNAAWSSDILPDDGKYQCWDDLANRGVKSNRDYILRASEVLLNEINKTGKANLNLFYEELGMMESQMGGQLGWTREDVQGYGGTKGMDFVAFGLTEMPDGSSATAFWFREPPTTDYEVRAQNQPKS